MVKFNNNFGRLNSTKVLSTLANPQSILPVAMIETACTLGRTYQGYKRGGKEEARERICEETTSAVFWLFGVKALNKVGDFIGKCAGIKNLDIDVGRDELRAPFLNIPKDELSKTSIFKFTKILGSAAIATAFIGIFLPKLNHKITNFVRKINGLPPIPERTYKKDRKTDTNYTNSKPITVKNSFYPDFNSFMAETKSHIGKNKSNAQKYNTGFSGSGALNTVMTLSHNLENNTVWRLMSTDVGTVTGRVVNSRNKYEAGEFLFRDTTSIYFYMFATSNTVALLNKIAGNTPIQPDMLEYTKNHLIKSIGKEKLTPDEFLKKCKTIPDSKEDIISAVPFNKDVISLDEFNNATKDLYINKAAKMSELQPKFGDKQILSKQQVEDIISSGWNCEPEFLKNAINTGTYGDALNPKKFVSRKTVESLRKSIDDFTINLANSARKKGKTVDLDFINSFAKQTTRLNLAFRIAGMAFSAFGLAFLIPKIQYKLTEMRTGSKSFPGTYDYSKE